MRQHGGEDQGQKAYYVWGAAGCTCWVFAGCDRAVLGFETLDIGEIIASIKPEVIALGYDQEELAQQVQSYVGMHKVHVAVVRIDKFEENSLDSSTKIKQK